jgi:uncharacterized BrkB/YihY/UPF0761 family membrane protein
LTVFPAHGVAYGGLSTAISLLLYLYFSAAVLLFGAELNVELRRPEGKGQRRGTGEPRGYQQRRCTAAARSVRR